jgi:peptidoglycan/LPS O-acetylase OafA/YrhL
MSTENSTFSSCLGDAGRNNIALQRLLLSSLVIVSHSYDLGDFGLDPLERLTGDQVSMGGWAVHAFFVLSGYLMAESWSRIQRPIPYLINRVLRIFPAFWCCLFVTALVLAPLLHWLTQGHLAGYWSTAPAPWAYIVNNLALVRGQNTIGLACAGQPFDTLLNAALWTLSWEFAGYLGVLILGIVGGIKSRNWMVIAAFLAFYLNLVLDPSHSRFFLRLYSSENTVRLPVFFLSGTCFWACCRHFTPSVWWAVGGAVASLVGSALGLYLWVLPLSLPCMLFGAATLFRSPALIASRDYSYGLYLYGFPVQRMLLAWPGTFASLPIYTLCSLLGALPLAIASWHGMEQRALGWKKPLAALFARSKAR